MNSLASIRQAAETDAPDIAELIYATSLACCFTPEQPCPDWYKNSVQPGQIASLLKSDHMVWLVAVQAQAIAGVLAVSDKSHVKYFFVRPAYQGLGLGKQLWSFASRTGVLGPSLTVRSSLCAVPVYERLGFVSVELPKTFNGMHYQTMVANTRI
jgi:GNAT superfamily N-acetyltransferase